MKKKCKHQGFSKETGVMQPCIKCGSLFMYDDLPTPLTDKIEELKKIFINDLYKQVWKNINDPNIKFPVKIKQEVKNRIEKEWNWILLHFNPKE